MMNKPYPPMEEVAHQDYLEFIKTHDSVLIENVKVPIGRPWKIKSHGPPADYKLETETVWSFPERGDWATHIGNYRANWSPFIPRNLILRYTREGEWVLDQMVGSGTTLVECKLLNRNAIGVDINPDAIMVTRDRLNFDYDSRAEIKTYVGDARHLDKIESNSIDLIATHPPYAWIVPFTKSKRVENDISNLSLEQYLKAMEEIAAECYRVLKPGKYCGLLIGDTRRRKHYVPISYRVLQCFLNQGFLLKEDIIKQQWKTKTTREVWKKGKRDFYLIAHEHLYVFRKPAEGERLSDFKGSTKWWD